MPKKDRSPQVYKTETQLKEEARAKQAAEALASAAAHKSELRKKHENFWYHYKWHTVAGIAAIFLLIFFVKDIFFRTKPDATIIVVSESFYDDYELENLASIIGDFAEDFNADKNIDIAYDFILLPKLGDEAEQSAPSEPDLTGGQQDYASMMKLTTVIAAGSDPIYLLDEAAYNYISKMGQSEDGESYNVFDAFSVPVGSHVPGFRDMRFYMRTAHSDEAYYQYCRQLLENLDGGWNDAQ